jgi:hypothetical protein
VGARTETSKQSQSSISRRIVEHVVGPRGSIPTPTEMMALLRRRSVRRKSARTRICLPARRISSDGTRLGVVSKSLAACYRLGLAYAARAVAPKASAADEKAVAEGGGSDRPTDVSNFLRAASLREVLHSHPVHRVQGHVQRILQDRHSAQVAVCFSLQREHAEQQSIEQCGSVAVTHTPVLHSSRGAHLFPQMPQLS